MLLLLLLLLLPQLPLLLLPLLLLLLLLLLLQPSVHCRGCGRCTAVLRSLIVSRGAPVPGSRLIRDC